MGQLTQVDLKPLSTTSITPTTTSLTLQGWKLYMARVSWLLVASVLLGLL
jgi:hypothetical protein